MELNFVLLTILKIVISTGLIAQQVGYADGAALMGGHMDNRNLTEADQLYDEYDYTESAEIAADEKTNKSEAKSNSEEIPNPSPLVLPGYNLPENIFNRGKPFYVEKDPLTGKIDFSHKSPSLKADESDQYDYINEDPSDDIYDKKNINRKDGSLVGYGSHKQADVNQLTPNFHDFLNLPVKYNPDKYVYPLISSSYASTKIQGSVNKFHNHKDTFGVQKTTTTKKTVSNPTYSTTASYFTPRTTQRTMATTRVTATSTTAKPTTVKRYPELTTPPANVLNAGMSHPSFSEEYEYYDSPGETTIATTTTKKPKPQDIYLTTQNVKDIYITAQSTSIAPPTTTSKRIMSLFEQLFGDYDETVTTTEATKPPSLFSNLPAQQSSTPATTLKTTITTTTQRHYPNIHAGPHTNVLTGSNMGLDNNYEYVDEDYSNEKIQDNIAVENKVHTKIEDSLSVEPLKPITKLTPVNKTIFEDKTKFDKKPTLDLNKNKPAFNVKPSNYGEYSTDKPRFTTPSSTTTLRSSSTAAPTTYRPATTTTAATRVTSLPLGENHINAPSLNRDPIIVATQNLREKLNSEKVRPESPQLVVELPPQPQDQQRPITQLVPSSSNIHIAPGQDTVSFVVGHHQSVGDEGQYVGTALKESPFDSKPFRPLYGHEATYSSNSDTNRPQVDLKPPQLPEVAGSAVTIQPLQNSEASLAIGMPVNGVKQVPGQVMDASLDNDRGQIHFPKVDRNKVVFPEDKKPIQSNLIPQRLEPQQQPSQLPNREVLKLNSKPMYHQLPSDLTPPKENDIVAFPPRYGSSDRPMRPPWDPRPGHFNTGKPEYVRPPRPPPNIAYKRIDNLPNILPQFRPNTQQHYPMGPPPYHYDQRLNRQPLLERPSNRPIGFFEKIGPPPHPNVYRRYPQKNILRGPPHQMPNIEERRPLMPPQLINQNFDIQERRPLAQQPPQSLDENQSPMAEDRIINEDPRRPELVNGNAPELNMYQTPPNIHIANRRNGDGDVEVETLQMIQAKNEKDKDKDDEEIIKGDTVKVVAQDPVKEITGDKTIYKVYPVNTAPIIDVDKKENAVMGTIRQEVPLPPSKINNDFNFEQQDRNEAPILKPHPRPPTFPVKSDFPYPLERPDSIRHPESSSNKLDEAGHDPYNFNNQWNSVGENLESRIVSGNGKINYGSNQISATLKTYTEKPIAIAYTPTEPNLNADKYSMPNYGSPVIPEIRPGTVENADTGYSSKNSEFTVHATMHTNPNLKLPPRPSFHEPSNHKFNHKIDVDMDAGPAPPQQDFQAPFQASVKLDAATNQGWLVVRDKNRTATVEETETTTLPLATTSEFDIENFKPQLIGGFKPLYSMQDVESRKTEDVPERQEK